MPYAIKGLVAMKTEQYGCLVPNLHMNRFAVLLAYLETYFPILVPYLIGLSGGWTLPPTVTSVGLGDEAIYYSCS